MQKYPFEKLKKCIKYKDYKTAIFLSLFIQEKLPEYKMLTGVLLYENDEYSRCIFQLKDNRGLTSLYYLSLAYFKLKNYNAAIECLTDILDGKFQTETSSSSIINNYLINSSDKEFIHSFLGRLYFLKGKYKIACENHRLAFLKESLIESATFLTDDENFFNGIKALETSDPIYEYYNNVKSTMKAIKSDPEIYNNIYEVRARVQNIETYLSNIPGTGTYFLSKLAANTCKYGQNELGLELFGIIRLKDPHFIQDMDVYSTGLWIQKNERGLGLLAEDILTFHFNSYVGWSVLANYYSLKNLIKESVSCLFKSLSIQENPFAYSLLGFEFNSKNQYLDAQKYFKSSICMQENNDKAYFGMGITLAETYKKQNADPYFKKAISLNPNCLNMKAYLIRFCVAQNQVIQAFDMALGCLNIKQKIPEEVFKEIAQRHGSYTEVQELILCELSCVFYKMNHKGIAKSILGIIQCRTTTYYKARCMIEKDE